MIYLLTAIGLSPGGSSTGHIYTQTVHRTTQITTKLDECLPCLVFASFTLAFVLQLRKNHGKTSVRVRQTSVRVRRTSEYCKHITKTPTHYKTHTNTHIATQTHKHTHTHTQTHTHTKTHTHQHKTLPHENTQTHTHKHKHCHTNTHAQTHTTQTHTHKHKHCHTNWNSDICWFFISYVERMHGTKSLKY
jgi:hypothetical protein